MSNPIIKVTDLHLSLIGGGGTVNILRGINLQVQQGETLSVVGPSGAGKTTLLMALAGLESITSGQIQVAGTQLSGLNEDRLAEFRRQHIGIVFQSFHLIPTMTALENVALPLEFSSAADALERAAAALAATGLAKRSAHFPGQLSGGEQQRVALARAFVSNPALIIADEPTGNLDQETGQLVMDLLFQLQQDYGTTLILITHDSKLAQRCQRTIRMADGQFVPHEGMQA
ncbi:MAG: ATP-binding cassette domain-containing protein [Deltaproteobacteria bacterium]|jgi:putative ABC transport system ATP-binding protein|nr:ATP-binding cassette domain-containing protein [Deltaproteobacteria bacterium]MCW8893464.1 ATP-binding cassette domain-containing protein [Deltaproteobacteria bacterium]MCW9049116.1 ATP-binding cassette domain-containing protein [Deltaproteobacteria bacterium]